MQNLFIKRKRPGSRSFRALLFCFETLNYTIAAVMMAIL